MTATMSQDCNPLAPADAAVAATPPIDGPAAPPEEAAGSGIPASHGRCECRPWPVARLVLHPDYKTVFGKPGRDQAERLADELRAGRALPGAVEVTPSGVVLDGWEVVQAAQLVSMNAIEVRVHADLADASAEEVCSRMLGLQLDRSGHGLLARARALRALRDLAWHVRPTAVRRRTR